MKRTDFLLLSLVIILTLFGLFMIYDASSVISFRDFGTKYHYIRDQSIWTVIGFGGIVFFSLFNYKKLANLALVFLIISLGLLVAVFLPGIGIKVLGAHRWINMGFFVLQPSEFVKLSLAIYLAAWFTTKERGRLPAFALLMGAVLLLVMLEPDMGTASIILIEAMTVYFLSGADVKQFIIGIPVIGIIGFLLIKMESYRMARLTAYLNLGKTLENAPYHLKQILIALGSGGISGVGIGNSLQKYAYLPENVTDSIFAIIGEEFGFIGTTLLIGVFFVIVWRGFYIASRAHDTFGKLLGGAITAFLAAQIVINLGAMTAVLPLTGVPLPFISYGGSALVMDLCCVGILLNISKTIDHKV